MEIKTYLNQYNISFKTFSHPPVFTCEEAEKYNQEIRGIHSKKLFLTNKKKTKFYLVILPADKKLDLKELSENLNSKLKFANEQDLKTILNLTPGAVSPFGLINDSEHKTEIIVDKQVWESDFVSFHPNINTETLELSKQDFHKFLESLENKTRVV